MVRAKFKVTEIIRRPGWNGASEVRAIRLAPVSAGSEENKRFYAATPNGSIELATVNVEAAAEFELGQEFYVDFTAAAAGA